MLAPGSVAHILRLIHLDQICSNLSDELLGRLIRVSEGDGNALREVFAAMSDAWLKSVLLQCALDDRGRLEIRDAVNLQRFVRSPRGRRDWTC